jgi:hypothetical protein
MVTIALIRKMNALEEEYGRILFNGNNVKFEGLTSVFVEYLNRGLTGSDGKKCTPYDSTTFIQRLKKHFSDQTLMAREI